ncbi:MAG: hypothetical protein LBC19_00595 [Tannerella sp.]|jgi:hypothetical protein|nr:hypothetical protein [Tannerella sp.]
MNKKIFIGLITASATTLSIGVNVHLSNKSTVLGGIRLAQIEALADEGGTAADYCYVKTYSSTQLTTKIPCDSRTNASTIYPCESARYDHYGSQDRCTK